MARKKQKVSPPVPGARLAAAALLREGDLIVFYAGRNHDLYVESVETDSIGHVRVRCNDDTCSSSFHPNELRWIVRQ